MSKNKLSGSSKIALTPSQLIPVVKHLMSMVDSEMRHKDIPSVFIWGFMGIGKTEIVRSIAREWGCDLLALHLPQFDPTDIKGIPIQDDNGKVRWVPSSSLPTQTRIKLEGTRADAFVSSTTDRDLNAFLIDPNGNLAGWVNYLDKPDHTPDGVSMGINYEARSVSVDSTFPLDQYELVLAEKCIIFLDELSAADPTTQNAALQLTLDRKINEYDVPFGSPIVAAGNREGDGAYVQQLSLALANRFFHFTLIPSTDDFIHWGIRNGIRSDILGYIGYSGLDSLCMTDPDKVVDGEYGFHTPRSWANLSEQLSDDILNELEQRAIIFGSVGSEKGQEFDVYRKNSHGIPNPDHILDGSDIPSMEFLSNMQSGSDFNLIMKLVHRLLERRDNIKTRIGNDPIIEDEEWKGISENFSTFLLNIKSKERCMFIIDMVSKMGIRLSELRGDKFAEFSKKHIKLFRELQ